MTNPMGTHQPTSEFRSALESEISRALRREVRVSENSSGVRRQRFALGLRLAATLAVGAFVGATPAQIQDARQRDSLIAAQQVEERIAVARVEYSVETFRIAKAKFDMGMLTREALANVEAELRGTESALATVRSKLEEIQASSAAPRDDLSAPLVGQRDFVKERLQLDMARAQMALSTAEHAGAEADMRQRVGSGSQFELEEARTTLIRAKARVEVLLGRLALRQRFLQERLAPAVVAMRAQIIEVQQELTVAQRELVVAEDRAKMVIEQERLGMVDRADVLRAQLESLRRSSDVKVITLKLKSLESSLAGRGGGG